jgi:hypothetical protein
MQNSLGIKIFSAIWHTAMIDESNMTVNASGYTLIPFDLETVGV